MLVLGYDPGGKKANGVAIASIKNNIIELLKVDTVDAVDDVIKFFKNNTNDEIVKAAGIDTYLSWGTGKCGWRLMDKYLQNNYPRVKNSVIFSNSARGAMAVQGMAAALRLRHMYPDIILNETHPKVLYFSQTANTYHYKLNVQRMIKWLQTLMTFRQQVNISNEHEWDAAFSAWATAAAITFNNWIDLIPQPNNLLFPAGPVKYYWK